MWNKIKLYIGIETGMRNLFKGFKVLDNYKGRRDYKQLMNLVGFKNKDWYKYNDWMADGW